MESILRNESGSGESFRMEASNSERVRDAINLVPVECCGGWLGCSKFRAAATK